MTPAMYFAKLYLIGQMPSRVVAQSDTAKSACRGLAVSKCRQGKIFPTWHVVSYLGISPLQSCVFQHMSRTIRRCLLGSHVMDDVHIGMCIAYEVVDMTQSGFWRKYYIRNSQITVISVIEK